MRPLLFYSAMITEQYRASLSLGRPDAAVKCSNGWKSTFHFSFSIIACSRGTLDFEKELE